MGLFKSLGKIVKGVTKPVKKVLKSPLGKAALLYGAYHFGPAALQPGQGLRGLSGWQKALTSKAPWLYSADASGRSASSGILADVASKWRAMGPVGKAATIGGATALTSQIAGPKLEDKIDIDVDSAKGDKDYRLLAEYYEPEWEQWLIDQGYSAEDAARMANERIFSSQGGRIGFYKGSDRHAGTGNTQSSKTPSGSGRSRIQSDRQADFTANPKNYRTVDRGGNLPNRDGILSNVRSNLIRGRAERELMNRMGLANRGNLWGILGKKSPDLWARQTGNPHLEYSEEDINRITEVQDYFNQGQGNFNITQDQYYDIFPKDKPPIDTGGGGEGQPYIWPHGNVGAVSSAVTENPAGDGDYYGFKEWADWEGQPTTPMFGGNKYRGVLASKGGRIGLFIGGMGGMNQGMNPMTMNQGIGAMNPMGSVRSQMMGRPMMGQDPRMAQMNQRQNINRGIQQVARPPKESEDTELLQLIKLLTSMGIPMEQLRGRTKDELVEMAVALKGKTQGGRDVTETAEVIEEEDIREQTQAAGGGLMRSRYAMGSAPTDNVVEESENIELAGTDTPAEDLENLQELRDSFFKVHGREPVSIEELKFFLRLRRQETNQGGLMRTGYAMGSSQFGMGTEHPIIPDKDGPQLDMRDTGGYQPHGKKEKHDDVRALLAQGEFVMTSDAVKGMGGGDRELGAKKMYDLMHSMEAMA